MGEHRCDSPCLVLAVIATITMPCPTTCTVYSSAPAVGVFPASHHPRNHADMQPELDARARKRVDAGGGPRCGCAGRSPAQSRRCRHASGSRRAPVGRSQPRQGVGRRGAGEVRVAAVPKEPGGLRGARWNTLGGMGFLRGYTHTQHTQHTHAHTHTHTPPQYIIEWAQWYNVRGFHGKLKLSQPQISKITSELTGSMRSIFSLND